MTRVAASVTVIPRESIERGLVSDVKELVRYEPGLSVRSDPFRFGLDTFAIRGVGGNRVAVEIDGIPAAGGFAVGSFSDSGRSFVDAAFLERVEVLRGPGVLPVRQRRHRRRGGHEHADARAPCSAQTGNAACAPRRARSGVDDGWHAVAIGATRVGAVEALLGYAHRAGSEADTAADVVPNPRDYTSDSLLARLNVDGTPGGPLALTVEGGRLQQETAVNAFLGLAGSRFANTTLLEGDDSVDRHRVSLGQRLAATAVVRFGRLAALRAGHGHAAGHARGTHGRAAAHAARADRARVPPRGPDLRCGVHRGPGPAGRSRGAIARLRVRALAVADRGAARRPADQPRHGRHHDGDPGRELPAQGLPRSPT